MPFDAIWSEALTASLNKLQEDLLHHFFAKSKKFWEELIAYFP
jgi:hypothetical protein